MMEVLQTSALPLGYGAEFCVNVFTCNSLRNPRPRRTWLLAPPLGSMWESLPVEIALEEPRGTRGVLVIRELRPGGSGKASKRALNIAAVRPVRDTLRCDLMVFRCSPSTRISERSPFKLTHPETSSCISLTRSPVWYRAHLECVLWTGHLGWLDERDDRIHDRRGRSQRERHLLPIR
jgi:hypothetical protein